MSLEGIAPPMTLGRGWTEVDMGALTTTRASSAGPRLPQRALLGAA
jgi:hypothetical protein